MQDESQRRIVLCFDGTNNNLTGGKTDTNVVKLCEVLEQGPQQLVYYDPGVGNAGTLPGVTWSDKVRGWAQRLWGLAFGKGVYENIAQGYLYVMRNWRPGDQLYVFGFSRGAFTARSVAGMVARFGILRPSMEELVPTLVHLYFSKAPADDPDYKRIVQQLRATYCTPEGASAHVWFVGVWDTVESVGSPFSRQHNHASSSIVDKRFHHVRQALALDEQRRSFKPRPYYIHPTYDYAAHGQSIKQGWWRGAHCDVGGGYEPPQAGLSDRTFDWMVAEAVALGLRVKPLAPPAPRLLVHSETYDTPWWALTGLWVRDFTQAKGERGDPPPKPPVQEPLPPMRMPQDTVWAKRQPTKGLAAAAVAAFVLACLHGMAITGAWTSLAELFKANFALAHWQLFWWQGGTPQNPAQHPLYMLLADLGFIAAYGYLLGTGLSRGFANWAGLPDVTQPPPRLLNLLGWSGGVVLFGDLAEDLFMLLMLATGALGWPGVQWLLAWGMSLAAAAKWLGLAGSAVLVVRAIR